MASSWLEKAREHFALADAARASSPAPDIDGSLEREAFSRATGEAAEKFDERDEEMSWVWLCAKLFFGPRGAAVASSPVPEGQHNGIPDSYWREVPCGHPNDPVAMRAADGRPVCHCGNGLDIERAIDAPYEAPGPVVHCDKCGCYIAIPPGTAPVSVGDEPGICGVICNCGPNGEPMACGYEKGHEPTAHSWSSLPTWTDRWRIVHNPHTDPKKSSMAIEGPPTNGSQIVYGVAMDRGVPAHKRGGERG